MTTVPADQAPPPPPTRRHHDDNPSAVGTLPAIRLMCSFGGRIVPRLHDDQLRYVGGDSHIIALHRNATSFSSLLAKISKFAPSNDVTIKYQLPNEDLDALISVTSDEDVENMMEEYYRLLSHGSAGGNTRMPRLRLFLFPSDGSGGFGSMMSTGSQKHDHWFVDALNGRPLERRQSEVSSITSEVPDYLFGLDNNSDEPVAKPKNSVSVSDPGSPGFVMSSSQYGSASSVASVPAIPDFPPVKIKPEAVESPAGQEVNHQSGYVSNPVWPYVPESVPVYYMSGPAPSGPLPARPVQPVQVPWQYVQRAQQVVAPGQFPVGYRPVYIGPNPVGLQPVVGVSNFPVRPPAMSTEASDLQGGRTNPVQMTMYHPAALVPPGAGESPSAVGSEMRIIRPSQ